jgi:hypothetical protein
MPSFNVRYTAISFVRMASLSVAMERFKSGRSFPDNLIKTKLARIQNPKQPAVCSSPITRHESVSSRVTLQRFNVAQRTCFASAFFRIRFYFFQPTHNHLPRLCGLQPILTTTLLASDKHYLRGNALFIHKSPPTA